MIIKETPLAGSYLLDFEPVEDERGYFSRVFCVNELAEVGLETNIVQINTAFNRHRGIVRGMHFQYAPNAEVKMVRCTRGAVYDVIVDIRQGSATFGQFYGVTLSADSRNMLYVPKGFAHGYQVLEDATELSYLVTAFYAPGSEGGVKWDDPAIGISWPLTENLLISERDQQMPALAEIKPYTE